MSRSIRTAAVLALGAALLVGGTALGDSGGVKTFDASLAGIPAGAAAMFPGITGGGAPWKLEKGDARLFSDGRLQVEVHGLVLAAGPNVGKNPFPTGRAFVSCNGGAVVVGSSVVDYSPEGDASVNERIELPAPCLGPVVFFAGITGGGPRWFAVTGG